LQNKSKSIEYIQYPKADADTIKSPNIKRCPCHALYSIARDLKQQWQETLPMLFSSKKIAKRKQVNDA